MSNKKYAFIDEFGAFGYDFENPGCTTHFLIGAVIVDESNLLFVSERVENIRKKYFQQGEIKSSKIGRNHKRRVFYFDRAKNNFLFMYLHLYVINEKYMKILGSDINNHFINS